MNMTLKVSAKKAECMEKICKAHNSVLEQKKKNFWGSRTAQRAQG